MGVGNMNRIEKGYLAIVGSIILLAIIFWGTIGYVVAHFIIKYW